MAAIWICAWLQRTRFMPQTDTSSYSDTDCAHDKQVKDLMGTEIAVSGIKDRQFQGVDDASNCVNDTACK